MEGFLSFFGCDIAMLGKTTEHIDVSVTTQKTGSID